MKRDTLSLDIETIRTVTDPAFDEPAHWSIFAVALGHQAGNAEPDVTVLFRDDHTVTAEGQLITRMIDWIAERTESSKREILTFNGVSYDVPILQHRAARIDDVEPGGNVSKRLDLLLDSYDHVDLFEDMRELKDEWVSLDDSLDQFNIAADEPEWMGEPVTGSDMPTMGLELITGGQNDELREVVHRYASSDVRPLFTLHDKLNHQAKH